MNLSDYQRAAARTLVPEPPAIPAAELAAAEAIVGLCAITSAMAELAKKGIFHQHGWGRQPIAVQVQRLTEQIRTVEATLRHPAVHPPLDPAQVMRLWCVIGLLGEMGEVVQADHLDTLAKELGDVLWYLAALATTEGIGLEEIAEANIYKLRQRYPDGWDAAASRHGGGEG